MSQQQKPSPSSKPAAVRARYEKWKATSNKRPTGVFKYVCADEAEKLKILTRLDIVKSLIRPSQPSAVSNEALLSELLDTYINARDVQKERNNTEQCKEERFLSSSTFVDKSGKDDPMFLASKESINHIANLLHQHEGCRSVPQVTEMRYSGHVVMCRIKCPQCSFSTGWNSSPYITATEGHNPMFLVNMKMAHAYVTSGLRRVQYETLAKGAGIGILKEDRMNQIKKLYVPIIEELTEESKKEATEQEIASTENIMSGIDIMTDARHGTRKNAKDTDVICLGEQTHKCLWGGHIKRSRDPVTQRHEMIGTKDMYNHFDNTQCPINIHVHDSNPSVTKYVDEERSPTVNQLDVWHETSKIPSKFKKISSGAKKNEGKTWHGQLFDKGSSVNVHVNWCIRNCGQNCDELKSKLENVVNHYQNRHDHCDPKSRCKVDPNYEPSKVVITSAFAASLLLKFIQSLNVYRRPERFVYSRNTGYVESFNRAIKLFHSKDVHFSDEDYQMRSNLAVLSWNENVDRPYTSVITETASQRKKKVLRPKTYTFKDILWNRLVMKF